MHREINKNSDLEMKGLSELVAESELKRMKAEDYKKEMLEAFPDDYPPERGILEEGTVFQNPPEEEHTGDRKAFKNMPWIDYWRKLVGYKSVHMRCVFCNRDIFSDINSPQCHSWRVEHPDERNYLTKDDYQAVGGHYHKNGHDNSDGYIILPVCKTCNGKPENYNLTLANKVLYVEEIGATVE